MKWMTKTLTTFLAASTAVACADASGGTDLPPDAEFGLETVDGAADNLLLEDGSAEAARILDFVNRPLGSDTAAQTFRSDLDTIIHSRAAESIVSARLGDDGAAGTRDDVVFDSLRQLDEVRFVGLATLGLLHEHVNGREQIDCGTAVGNPGGSVTIEGLDDLMNIERSGCTRVEGDLRFAVYNLPDVDRDLARIQGIESVGGDLVLRHFPGESFELRALRSVGGSIVVPTYSSDRIVFDALESVGAVSFGESGYGRLEMPRLTQAGSIDTGRSPGIEAPRLAALDTLRLECGGEHVFGELADVADFEYVAKDQCAALELPALHSIGTFTLRADVVGDELGRPDITAPVVEQIESIDATSVWLDHVELGVKQVAGDVVLDDISELNGVFPRLESVGGQVSVNSLNAPATGLVHDFAQLRTIGGDVILGLSWSDIREARLFENVESLDGLLSVSGGCDSTGGEVRVFESAITAGNVDLGLQNCRIFGFDRLEVADTLHSWGQMEVEAFPALRAVGSLIVDHTAPGLFPSLEWVGSLDVMEDRNIRGFEQLETVEEYLSLHGLTELNGLQALRVVGGDIFVGYSQDELVQRLVDQLTFFGGELVMN